MENTPNVFSIENMSFAFGRHQPQLFLDINVQFPSQEVSFLSGKNGSGKSTLFRILSGGTNRGEIVSGTMTFPSNPSKKYLLNQRNGDTPFSRVKLVPQNFDRMIADQFSFIENLKLANLPAYPSLAPLPKHKPIPEFIRRFSIDFNKPAFLLSGGQRQILAILMALQKPTEILLLDEPTAALDEKNAMMVMEFLAEFLKMNKLTILVICHDYLIIKMYAQGYYYFLDVPHDGRSNHVNTIQTATLRKLPVDKPLHVY